MSKPKTHLEIVLQPPNESDTLGYSVTACGRESFEESTEQIKFVTCKNCLKKATLHRTGE